MKGCRQVPTKIGLKTSVCNVSGSFAGRNAKEDVRTCSPDLCISRPYRGKDGRYINPDYKYARLPLRFVLRNCRLHCRRLSSDRFSWALVCSPSFPCLVNRACLCSTRSSSKIAHEDTPFGELPFLRFHFTNLSISPISVNDTGECLKLLCVPDSRFHRTSQKASRIPRIFTRPSHLAKPNPFCPCCTTTRRRNWPTDNSECGRAPPCSAAPRSIRSRSRHAHPRAPRKYLRESFLATVCAAMPTSLIERPSRPESTLSIWPRLPPRGVPG